MRTPGVDMKTEARRELAERILRTLKSLRKRRDGRGAGTVLLDFYLGSNLPPAGLEEYAAIRRQLLESEGLGRKFSEYYLDLLLRAMIGRLIEKGDLDETERQLGKLVTSCEQYSETQTVYVPLVGIQLRVRRLKLGKVVLKKTTQRLIDRLECEFAGNTSPGVRRRRNGKRKRRSVEGGLAELRKSPVHAEFSAIAEPAKAIECAVEETARVVDLLHYAISCVCPDEPNVLVGFAGQVAPASLSALVVRSSNLISELRESEPLEISRATVDRMRQAGVFEVSQILQKAHEDLTDSERTLIRGIHWFADSRTQSEKENELLSLMTCLETLFGIPGSRGKGERVACTVAQILEDEPKRRRCLRKTVVRLYKLRSGITHGEAKHVLDSDVSELRWMAAHVLGKAVALDLENQFDSQKSLFFWLKDEAFG